MQAPRNRRKIGGGYEQLAAAYLHRQGLTILYQNYRCRMGEADLIAMDGLYLVFVEVKYRSSLRMGYPSEAVNGAKQLRLRKVAQCFLYSCQYPPETPCRFDVVSILGRQVRWIRDAF